MTLVASRRLRAFRTGVPALLAICLATACTATTDGRFGGSGVIVRADHRSRVPPPQETGSSDSLRVEQRPSVAVAEPGIPADPAVFVALDPSRPFDDRLPPPEEPREHVPAAWPFDVERYEIEVEPRPSDRTVRGRVRIDVVDRVDGLIELPLDDVEMKIGEVKV
jgi:hypothetical protein